MIKEVILLETPVFTKRQLLFIIISSINVTGHLLFISEVINSSGRDGWLSLPLGIISGLIFALILSKLVALSPGDSIVEISCTCFGKIIGKFIGINYVGYFILVASITLGTLMDFMTMRFMLETPALVFGITFLLVCTYAVFLGLETLLRSNEMLLPFLILAGITISIMAMPDKDYKNLLPILENGATPVLRGSVVLITLMTEIVVFCMIHPGLRDPAIFKRTSIIAILIIGIMFIGPLTGPISVFGLEAASMHIYPTFEEIKHIQVNFIGNFSPFGVLLWLAGSYAKISVFYYASSLGATQLLGLSDYKKAVIPVGLIILIVSIVAFPNIITIRKFITGIYTFISIYLGFLLPSILLIILSLKKYLRNN